MRKLKRALCAALAGVMVFSLAGCGKNSGSGTGNGNGSGKSSEAKNENPDTVFGLDDSFSIDGIEGEVTSFVLSGDKLYIASSEWVEDASESDASETDSEYLAENPEGSSTTRVYSCALDGGSAELLYEHEEFGSVYLNKLVAKPDGTPCFVMTDYGEDGDKAKFPYYEYDGSEFKEVMDLASLSSSSDTYIDKVYYLENGNFAIVFESEIKILDSNFKEVSSVNAEDGYFDATAIDKNGDIIACSYDYNEETEESSCTVKKLDIEQGKFTDEYPVEVSYIPGNDGLMTGVGDYDFFYKTSSALYGYKYADKAGTKVFDFGSSDVNSDYIYGIKMLSADELLCTYYDADDVENATERIVKFKKVDPSEVKDRVILTLGSTYGNYFLKQAVSEYNKSQSKYKIKFIDYSEESDPASKLSADIAAGDIPDMLDVSDGVGNMSLNQCIAKGLLEDLTPYVEKDPDIKKEDFIPSMYESMLHDGKLYYSTSGATIMTLIARKSEVGDEMGWTFQEMKEYVDSQPDNARIFYSDNKTDILESFMYSCGKDFVNWDKGECYFDSQDFKDVLEMSNRGTNDEMVYDEEMPSTAELIKNHEMLFVDGSVAIDLKAMYDKMFDGDSIYKGYPNKDKKGNFFMFDDSVAMSSKCADKDAAWDFIRMFMTEEYQGKHYISSYCIPTREDVYEAYVQMYTCTEETKDKYGNDIYPLSGSMGMSGFELESKPLTQEEVDEYRKFIDSASGVWEADTNIYNIVKEEAAAYFSGDKSIDDVCEIIQNRATTYVNENK